MASKMSKCIATIIWITKTNPGTQAHLRCAIEPIVKG